MYVLLRDQIGMSVHWARSCSTGGIEDKWHTAGLGREWYPVNNEVCLQQRCRQIAIHGSVARHEPPMRRSPKLLTGFEELESESMRHWHRRLLSHNWRNPKKRNCLNPHTFQNRSIGVGPGFFKLRCPLFWPNKFGEGLQQNAAYDWIMFVENAHLLMFLPQVS